MTYVFERDENGLLHQVNLSLEDISAAGRNINLLSIQTCYVLFTAEQEKQRAVQVAEAKAREDARLADLEAKRQAREVAKQAEINKAKELEQAKKDAEAQKNQALTLALEQIKVLSDKIAAMEASSQSPQS